MVVPPKTIVTIKRELVEYVSTTLEEAGEKDRFAYVSLAALMPGPQPPPPLPRPHPQSSPPPPPHPPLSCLLMADSWAQQQLFARVEGIQADRKANATTAAGDMVERNAIVAWCVVRRA